MKPSEHKMSHPLAMLGSVETTSAYDFSALARRLAAAAHQLGLDVPGFRTPPRVAGSARTVRRFPDGSILVAVRTSGRTIDAVAADMIEGVVVANHLHGAASLQVRTHLLAAMHQPQAKAA